MATKNLGNVVGLIKSPTPPTKTFVLWAKQLNPALNPDLVELHYYNGTAWVPLTSGGGDGFYFEVTRSQALDLVNTNSLTKGATYKILESSIYLTAINDVKFSKQGKIISRFPHYYGTPNLIGMWSELNAIPMPINIGDKVIHGARVWESLTGNIGSSEEVVDLNLEDWQLIPRSNEVYYQEYEFGIDYDFENDIIMRQWDDRGNEVIAFMDAYNFADYCDWLQSFENFDGVKVYRYSNFKCLGLFANNFFLDEEDSIVINSTGLLFSNYIYRIINSSITFMVFQGSQAIEITNSEVENIYSSEIGKIINSKVRNIFDTKVDIISDSTVGSIGSDGDYTEIHQIVNSNIYRIERSVLHSIENSQILDIIDSNISSCSISNSRIELIHNLNNNHEEVLRIDNCQIRRITNSSFAMMITSHVYDIDYLNCMAIENNVAILIDRVTCSILRDNTLREITNCQMPTTSEITNNRCYKITNGHLAISNIRNNYINGTIDATNLSGNIEDPLTNKA